MSILRSSKFFRYFLTFARNIYVTRSPEVDRTLIQRSLHLVNNNSSFATQAALQKGSKIEKFIQRLDQDVRRSGRINRSELLDALNEIRNSRHATSTQSLLIIRCCGNLVAEESPQVRTTLVNDVWNTLEKIGVPLDISHYNALLRVYLENEHSFSPSQFLTDLQNKGVEPNRVTYQRLVAAYCQQGDIEGATRILEFMKEKQIPVNESVFNALITGHFQADDMESAVGILGVMNQANIKPSAETYTALMSGYAKNGNIDAINEIFSQAAGQEIDISDKNILEIMFTLAINNHMDLMDQLTGRLQKLPGYNQDAKNIILRLISRGEDKAAVKTLQTMKPNNEGEPVPVGNFLIRQMVKSNRPIENILNVCEELKETHENENSLLCATEASLVFQNPILSMQLLEALSKQHELCPHYFWPVLIQHGKAGDVQGIIDTLTQMIVIMDQPINGETLRDYVIPYIPTGEKGIFFLRKSGVPLATSASAMVGHLLMKNNISAAAQIALQFKANYAQAGKYLVSSFIETGDLESFITLVRILEDCEKEEEGTIAEKILLDVVQSLRKKRAETITAILQKYLQSGLGISNQAAEDLQNMLSGIELNPEISSLLSKLASDDLTPAELNRPPIPKRGQTEKTESNLLRLIKLTESKNEMAWGLKRQLLMQYCANKELEKAEDLMKEMETGGFEFQIGTLVSLMDLYVHHEKLPEALGYYNEIVKNPDNRIDSSKILKLATLMTKNDNVQDAIDLLSKHKVNEENTRAFSFNSISWKLLNALAEKKNVENLKQVFNALIENKFIEPTNVMLGPLIKVHILRDDYDSALAEFEACCSKYRATPWKNEIACQLIQKEDPVSLQRLTDLSTQIHGEINSLYDLVLSFVECGRIRQARKILETPGLKVRSQRINSACERYDSEGNVNHLENLVEATKDMSHIDRADIYYHLLSSYCKSDEVDKAEGLWTQMQDEDVQPSERFLIKLAELLQKHNKTVPFAIPKAKENIKVSANVEEVNHKVLSVPQLYLKNFRSAVHSNNAEEALDLKSKLNDSDLSNTERSKLLNLLILNGKIKEATTILIGWLKEGHKTNIKTLSFLINNLAKAGEIEALEEVGKYLNEDMKRMTSYLNRYTHCMVEAGRSTEVLSLLESNIQAANSQEDFKRLIDEFPRGGIYSVFDKSPELIPQFETIATQYREKGILDPTNVLWIYYTISKNNEKALEAWSYVKESKRLMFQPILKRARKDRDVTSAEELLKLCRTSSVPKSAFGVIYSAMIDISIENETSVEDCILLLDKAIEECSINNIHRDTLVKLKKNAVAERKEFKYSIPARKKQSSSDSSDSSDSESETPQKASSR